MGGLNEKEDEYIKLVQTGWIVIFHSFIHVRTLGAKEIVPREGFQGEPRYICQRTIYLQIFLLWMFLKFVFLVRPLGKELYAGAIDACGGKVLANILPLVWRQTFLFR